MKWMCYGAGLLVATTALLVGTDIIVVLLFAAGATAIMAGFSKRVLGAEPPSGFGRSPEGSFLWGIGMYTWGAHVLYPTTARGPLMVATLALLLAACFLEIRERSSYAPEG